MTKLPFTADDLDVALEGWLFACDFEPLMEKSHRQVHKRAAGDIYQKLTHKHEWVDARNEIVTEGEMCRCGALRPGNQGPDPEPESTVLAPALVYALGEGKRVEAASLLAVAIHKAIYQQRPAYHEEALKDAAAILATLLGEEVKWAPTD